MGMGWEDMEGVALREVFGLGVVGGYLYKKKYI